MERGKGTGGLLPWLSLDLFYTMILYLFRWMTEAGMAVNNPLTYYLLLRPVILLLPDGPARLALINGLMSESMLLWFLVYALRLPGKV